MRWVSAAGALFALAWAMESNAAPSVVEAKKALEGARAKVGQAVARIEKDPPATADLDAALSAVEALKAAIDAGAELEPKDLEYAKAALAARKELRTHRAFVEDRRAKVHIHESRRAIDRALAAAGEAKDIEAARKALAEVEKAVEAGRAHVAQDQKYGTYLAEVRAELDRRRKALDERATAEAVGRQTSQLEDKRKALAAALGAIGEKAGDAAFEAADRALAGLTQALEAGRALEGRDKTYRALAESAKKEALEARRRIDDVWSKTGLARLKAELDPARSDLADASAPLRSKNPTTDQIAEARTAAIVVRKLVEKVRTQAARSASSRQYVADVEKLLVEVEVHLARRGVEPASDAVTTAVDRLSRAGADPAAFEAIDRAVAGARRILDESLHLERSDRAYGSYASDVRKRLDAALAKASARRSEIEVQNQRAALDGAARDLSAALTALKRRAPSDEQFAEAQTAAIVLEKTLDATKGKDAALSRRTADLRSTLKTARRTIDDRRLEVDVDRRRAEIEDARRDLAARVSAMTARGSGTEQVVAVEAGIVRARQALADGADLAKRDGGYRSYHREVEKRIDEIQAKVARRHDEIAFAEQRALVEPAMKALARAIATLDRPTEEEVVAAETQIQAARSAIREGEGLEQNVRDYATWVRPVKKTLEQAEARIARAKREVALAGGRSELDQALRRAKSALAAAKEPGATDAHLAEAANDVARVQAAIAGAAPLEKDDPRFADHVAEARETFERFDAELQLARGAHALRRALLDGLALGTAADEAAAKAKDLRAQRAGYEKAAAALDGCRTGGEAMVERDPALANIVVMVGGGRPKDVIADCVERAGGVKDRLAKVVGLIQFEEGPSKSFEDGRVLLGQAGGAGDDAKKKDLMRRALVAFEECISSGKILRHKNPELVDRKLDVMGGRMTLAELIAACTKDTEQIRAKK